MIRVLLDEDGLLQRFGRLDPDAAGLVATLQRLQAGLARRPRPQGVTQTERERQSALSLGISAVRFVSATPGSESESVTGLPLRVWDSVADLASGDLYFTASHTRLTTALRTGATAFAVGLEHIADQRVVDFATVPRLVQEALRLPTPRPRSPATRRGGLVVISVGSHAQARAESLEATRVDPQADWVRLGDSLLLYTEDPDLEDRLVERPDVERLSYAVARDDLVFELPSPGSGGSSRGLGVTDDAVEPHLRAHRGAIPSDATDTVFRRGEVLVRVVPSSTPRPAPDASSTATARGANVTQRPWRDVRRRFLDVDTRGRDDEGRRRRTDASDRELAAFRAHVTELEADLRPRLRMPLGLTLVAALEALTGPTASVDAWPTDTLGSLRDAPSYVAWQTPYGGTEADGLQILRHEIPSPSAQHGDPEGGGAVDPNVLVHSVAVALASADFLQQQPSALGTLHVLHLGAESSRAPADAATATPTSLFMLTAERNRVRADVEFPTGPDKSAALQSVLSQLDGGEP